MWDTKPQKDCLITFAYLKMYVFALYNKLTRFNQNILEKDACHDSW